MSNGKKIYKLIKKLFPVNRSITGNGVRESLKILQDHIPFKIHEVPTGTDVLDWQIPKEWNIRDAWIKDPAGNKIVDFRENNLHLLNYSVPVDKKVSLEELKQHLYTLPDQPDLIPYRTSYYSEKWGFCMRHHQYETLKEGEYQVYIDSELKEGSLTYGELFIKGKSDEEVLISSHICHPSLANDNLSGVAVAVSFAKYLLENELNYSWRFLFIPGTIGSITWLARNEEHVNKIRHGLVLSCVGDSHGFTYKKSRRENSEIDRIIEKVIIDRGEKPDVRNFLPYGYDERQYCSPGFDLPVGCLMRSHFGEFPEYHTSADNLDFVKPESLQGTLDVLIDAAEVIEGNGTYTNCKPKGEPNLGKRNLYSTTGGGQKSSAEKMAILWVLNQSDGNHSLFDIAERSGLTFKEIRSAADALLQTDLLREFNRKHQKI
jgi:aminopeptidase-like protein